MRPFEPGISPKCTIFNDKSIHAHGSRCSGNHGLCHKMDTFIDIMPFWSIYGRFWPKKCRSNPEKKRFALKWHENVIKTRPVTCPFYRPPENGLCEAVWTRNFTKIHHFWPHMYLCICQALHFKTRIICWNRHNYGIILVHFCLFLIDFDAILVDFDEKNAVRARKNANQLVFIRRSW